MSIEIKIGLGDDAVSASALDHHMAALGFTRSASTIAVAAATAGMSNPYGPESELPKDAQAAKTETVPVDRAVAPREHGKPSAGRSRRTKEEIAEDEAFEKRWEENEEKQDAEEAEAKAAISSGENRVGPEDAPEVQEQDKADEQAERAATTDSQVLSRDDVRHALGLYVEKFGMAAAQQDGPKLIQMVCGAGKVKLSDIPEDDQALLRKVVDGMAEMLAKNPYDRNGVA